MSSAHLALLGLSSILDLALLVALLRARPERELTLARLTSALIATAAFATVKMMVLCVVVQSFFFAVALGYADLVVVTPLAALTVLLASPRRRVARAVRSLALCALVLLPALGVYASCIEPRRLVEERVDVALEARVAPSQPLRIAVLADLQSRDFDEHLRDAVASALAFEPHLIVLPGDLIQLEDQREYERVTPRFRELLAPLRAPLGVYFVVGNTDTPELVGRVFEGTQVRLLRNELVELEFHGRRIALAGVDFSFASRSSRAFLSEFGARDEGELRILLAHYPDVVLALERAASIDLTIAGHTHGGQVQLPFFGPPLTLSSVPRAAAAGGLHAVDGFRLYVSRGVGAERGAAPLVRFLCPPEVSLLTLRAAAGD